MSKYDVPEKSFQFPTILAVLGIFVFGIFFIYQSGYFSGENEPIPREAAVSYVGEFESYEASKNYCWINFQDGSYYAIHAHTEKDEFREAMKALSVGTRLSILVNPNNDYVIEVKTDTQELLNFDTSQKDIRASEYGYMNFGIVLCAIDVMLASALLTEWLLRLRRNKKVQHTRASVYEVNEGYDTPALRSADKHVKCRILLEKQIGQYHICYRRVKKTNELVINGYVYDEYVALIEFEHALYAMVDGHHFEVGFDADSYSYIKFDGQNLVRKMRLI